MATSSGSTSGAGKYESRKRVMYEGRVIYEWEQTLEDVDMYVQPPPGVTAKMIDIVIDEQHVRIGIKGSAPYLNEDLGGLVVKDDSFWTLEDGEIHVHLQKGLLGSTWVCCTRGAGTMLDPTQVQQEQQKLLLERFQRENPGFDFSNASFNGTAPDPRSFLGGVDRTRLQR